MVVPVFVLSMGSLVAVALGSLFEFDICEAHGLIILESLGKLVGRLSMTMNSPNISCIKCRNIDLFLAYIYNGTARHRIVWNTFVAKSDFSWEFRLNHFNNDTFKYWNIKTKKTHATTLKNVWGVVQIYGFHCWVFIQLVLTFLPWYLISPVAKWSLLCSNCFLINIVVCAIMQIGSTIMKPTWIIFLKCQKE